MLLKKQFFKTILLLEGEKETTKLVFDRKQNSIVKSIVLGASLMAEW